jgi:hypothetical protein
MARRQTMNMQQGFFKMVVSLSLVLILAGVAQFPQPAWASMEDAAIFYEELNQYGDWVEDETYGPMWYPTQVQENWRPYVDGRWTPAEEGYVFETEEPWGSATYHYGNWMPTEEYGWVWVPGRTWYPNTVTWRTSPESESPDESYIGWAPIPPPNYTPQPGYYPEGYYGGTPYPGPFEKLITAPFWIFVRAANFLSGFAESYSPAYSYGGCNCLVPPQVVPYYYNRTAVVHNYYTPRYYPVGYISAGLGYYNWGPPIPYVARVTRIKHVTINNYIKKVNIYKRRNVVPPRRVLARRAYFRDVMPPAMAKRRPLPRGVRVRDIRVAQANLVRPNLVKVKVIKNAPTIKGKIPKTRLTKADSWRWKRGVSGAALPASAMIKPNQQMEEHRRKIPSSRRIEPVSPRARKWQVPQTPGAATAQPAASTRPRAHGARKMKPQHTATPQESLGRRQRPPSTQATTPGGPGPSQADRRGKRFKYKKHQPGAQGPTPGGSQASAPGQRPFPRKQRGTVSGEPPGASVKAKPGKTPSQMQRRPPETSRSKTTPGHYPGQRQKQRYTPGTPPSSTATPARVQPQRRQRTQPQQQQHKKKKTYTDGQPQSDEPRKPQKTGVQPSKRQYQPQTRRQVRQQPRVKPRAQTRYRSRSPKKQQQKKQKQE